MAIFDENYKHEQAIILRYVRSKVDRNMGLSKLIRARKKGASKPFKLHNLNRKTRRCYPRGKAWERVLLLDNPIGEL